MQTKRAPMNKKEVKLYKKGDFNKIKEEFEAFKSDVMNDNSDSLTANELWVKFRNKLESLVE